MSVADSVWFYFIFVDYFSSLLTGLNVAVVSMLGHCDCDHRLDPG